MAHGLSRVSGACGDSGGTDPTPLVLVRYAMRNGSVITYSTTVLPS